MFHAIMWHLITFVQMLVTSSECCLELNTKKHSYQRNLNGAYIQFLSKLAENSVMNKVHIHILKTLLRCDLSNEMDFVWFKRSLSKIFDHTWILLWLNLKWYLKLNCSAMWERKREWKVSSIISTEQFVVGEMQSTSINYNERKL